jgi:hypothetical protein
MAEASNTRTLLISIVLGMGLFMGLVAVTTDMATQSAYNNPLPDQVAELNNATRNVIYGSENTSASIGSGLTTQELSSEGNEASILNRVWNWVKSPLVYISYFMSLINIVAKSMGAEAWIVTMFSTILLILAVSLIASAALRKDQ